ncbi:MAG: MFS transporter [Spirochaetaceae bacterium]|nr:MAG: MFS transporter [Spirochaetaceae bacterium]
MGHSSGEKKLHYGWIIVGLSVAITVGALGLGRFGYTVVLPSMKIGLGMNAVKAADLATGNMVGYLSFSVISGLLAARFGARAVISFFLLVVSVSMFLSGLANSYPLALLARTLTGIGSAGANIPAMALVAVWFSPRRRGLATGIAVSGASIGLVVTGLLVPVILRKFGAEGWRWAWFVFSAFAFLVAVLASIFLRNAPGKKGLMPVGSQAGRAGATPLDRLGGEPRGSTASPHNNSQPRRGNQTRENNTAPEVLGRGRLNWSLLYKSGQIWHLAGIYVLFGFSYVIYATFFVDYLTSEVGFPISRAGSLWSAIGMFSIISGFIWGSVSDRLGRKYGLALVFLLQGTSYALFGLWRSVPGFYLSALFFALTAWSVPAIMAASAGDLLGTKMAAAAFGFISLLLSVGQVLGPFAAGRIAALTGSYSYSFLSAALAALLGAVAALFLRMSAARE